MYWQADLAHRQGDFNLSAQLVDKFTAAAGTGKDLKDPMLLPMANYLQGYNQLKKEAFLPAGEQFNAAIDKLKKNGFKWSPTNMAWQRQLTSAGRSAVQSVLKELGHEDLVPKEI